MKIRIALLLSVLILSGCAGRKGFSIEDSSQVNGLLLGARMGTTHEGYLKHDYPDSEILIFGSETDLLNALMTDKIDVMAVDYPSFRAMDKPEYNLTVLERDWHVEPFGMIFSKENTELLSTYNAFLKDLKESGELAEIQDRWMNEGESAEMPDFTSVPRTGPVLKVGCTGTTALFDFIRDGKLCGLDIEIIERFAAATGRPTENRKNHDTYRALEQDI